MSNDPHIVEQFFGVYLLYCENPKYLGRTYIGFTVDPNRRIKQHNKGKHAGGAWKTSNKGPWKMVLIVHGFPNDIAALRFEWAWQHPLSSRRLQHLPKKKNNEKIYEYLLKVLSEMLKTGPWNRLPLTLRWLEQDFARDLMAEQIPPMHIPICYGPVVSKKLKNKPNSASEESNEKSILKRHCFCCGKDLNETGLTCLLLSCDMISHVECLAKLFLETGEYIPIEGNCPKCETQVLWGDLIRKSQGCYSAITEYENYSFDSD